MNISVTRFCRIDEIVKLCPNETWSFDKPRQLVHFRGLEFDHACGWADKAELASAIFADKNRGDLFTPPTLPEERLRYDDTSQDAHAVDVR